MTRWNIRTLAFYSHDGRRRDVDLDVGAVNILTGPSHTGKSAIVEMLDYCLGSSECHLPGIVREAVSWVGVIWERGSDRFAVARGVPSGNAATVNEMYWRKGSSQGEPLLPASADNLVAVGSRDAVMRLIEEAFGIGDVHSETLNPARPGVRVSARHVVPYLLQDDDVIISKTTLVRGANDERRQHIVDTLPYFLGVSDEKAAALEAEFRRVSKQVRLEERGRAELERLTSSEQDRAFGLISEAAQLGLCEPLAVGSTLVEALNILESAARWTPNQPTSEGNTQLEYLYGREGDARARVTALRARIRATEHRIEAFNGYGGAVSGQVARLAHIDAFRSVDDSSTCPVCNSELADVVPKMATLRAAQNALKRELAAVGQDRPKLDVFLNASRDELQEAQRELRTIQREISTLVGESDASAQRLDLDHRRSRIVGRMSLYLESRAAIRAPASTDSLLASLRRRRDELGAMIDDDAKRERLEIDQQTIGNLATKLLVNLPFEEEYRNADVYFNARTLSCGIATQERRVPMRDVGSDENYLSLHVAVLVAMHRFFGKRKSPVPGVLLFDQLSRPYYPPDARPEEIVLEDDTEGGALKRYFDFLFAETARQAGLQVIILEHAYFAADEQFMKAVKERWSRTGNKLIPADWPRSPS